MTAKRQSVIRRFERVARRNARVFLDRAFKEASKAIKDPRDAYRIIGNATLGELSLLLGRKTRPRVKPERAMNLLLCAFAADVADIPFEHAKVSIIDKRELGKKVKAVKRKRKK